MAENRIDTKIISRLEGKSFKAIKNTFLSICDSFLSINQDVQSELITVYIKFFFGPPEKPNVFGVVWLKTSKEVVVGLALREEFKAELLHNRLKGFFYSGLTKFLIIKPEDAIPVEFPTWIKMAFENRKAA